jgi:hypothetical protein
LECLRLFRRMRKRVGSDLTYGHHMAIGMAIGFLFLGGGRQANFQISIHQSFKSFFFALFSSCEILYKVGLMLYVLY